MKLSDSSDTSLSLCLVLLFFLLCVVSRFSLLFSCFLIISVLGEHVKGLVILTCGLLMKTKRT